MLILIAYSYKTSKSTYNCLQSVKISSIKRGFKLSCINSITIRTLGTTRVYGLTYFKSIQSLVCLTVFMKQDSGSFL